MSEQQARQRVDGQWKGSNHVRQGSAALGEEVLVLDGRRCNMFSAFCNGQDALISMGLIISLACDELKRERAHRFRWSLENECGTSHQAGEVAPCRCGCPSMDEAKLR